jgi:hypothetical protein
VLGGVAAIALAVAAYIFGKRLHSGLKEKVGHLPPLYFRVIVLVNTSSVFGSRAKSGQATLRNSHRRYGRTIDTVTVL